MNDFVEQSELREVSLRDLLRRLGSRTEAIRAAALAELNALPAESVKALERQFDRFAPLRKVTAWVSGCGALGGSALLVIYKLLMFSIYGPDVPLLFCVGVMAVVGAGLWADVRRPTRFRRRIIESLSHSENPAVVGMLLAARRWPDKKVPQLTEEGLSHLLPQLTPDDRFLLTQQNYTDLHDVLYSYRSHLVLAVLQALEQVGNGVSAECVRTMFDYPYHLGHSDVRVPDRSAADHCLKAILTRLEKERPAETLLRPTSDPGSPADTLLRPLQGAASTDPHTLLRAIVQDES